MKRLLFVVLAFVMAAGIAGCGSSSDSDSSPSTGIIAMELGVEYQVNSGDRVEPDGADSTEVSVRHVFEDDTKYVTLLSGSALLHQSTP